MKHRFIKEYANYIKKRLNSADIPHHVKQKLFQSISYVLSVSENGEVETAECMDSLAQYEYILNGWENGHDDESTLPQ